MREYFEARDRILGDILKVASKVHPQEFQAWFLGGILANVLGEMPDEYWSLFKKKEACPEVGCDCHIVFSKFTEQLQIMRDDWKKHGAPEKEITE